MPIHCEARFLGIYALWMLSVFLKAKFMIIYVFQVVSLPVVIKFPHSLLFEFLKY